jgi:uncharacterized protein (TIGR02421 family)
MPGKKFMDYSKLDQKLFEIAGALETNLIKFINPQNLEEQKTRFFSVIENKIPYNPVFSYIPRNPLYAYFSMSPKLETFKNELKEMLKEIERDDLGIVFESEIIDLIEKIEVIKSIGTENFSENSKAYYGSINKTIIRQAKETIKQNTDEQETPILFEEAIQEIKKALKKDNLAYNVVIREPAGARFAVINSRKEVLINKDTKFTKEMVERLIIHEIQTHIYRYENGARQPFKILAQGFSRETTETEEGLAVCLEKLGGVSSKTQMKEYAGRLMAITHAQEKNFYETFLEMNKHFDKEAAFRLTVRAKRGIKNQEKPGAFYKDSLYFKGMLKVEEFLKKHDKKELYYGKYAIEDIPLVKSIPGLKEPKYLPEILSNN